jgi:hypothetical protein
METLCRTSERGEQSGLRDHKPRSQRLRQHLHRRHRSDRHQPLSLPPGASPGVHAARNFAFVDQVNALTSYFGGSGRGLGPGLMARAAIYQQLNLHGREITRKRATFQGVLV